MPRPEGFLASNRYNTGADFRYKTRSVTVKHAGRSAGERDFTFRGRGFAAGFIRQDSRRETRIPCLGVNHTASGQDW